MSDERRSFDERRVAELLAALPPAPEAWVNAAKALPMARREIDQLVALARADAALREATLADLEGALRARGVEPRAALLESLRSKLA